MEERNFFHSTQSNTMEQEIADALTEQAAAAEGERQLLEGISPPEIGLETKESGTGRVKDRREIYLIMQMKCYHTGCFVNSFSTQQRTVNTAVSGQMPAFFPL